MTTCGFSSNLHIKKPILLDNEFVDLFKVAVYTCGVFQSYAGQEEFRILAYLYQNKRNNANLILLMMVTILPYLIHAYTCQALTTRISAVCL